MVVDLVSHMNVNKIIMSHIHLVTITHGFYHKVRNHVCLLVAFHVPHTNFAFNMCHAWVWTKRGVAMA